MSLPVNNLTRFKHNQLITVALAIALVSMMALVNCRQAASKPDTELDTGRKLSITYCQSCHKYPDAGLIDRQHWERRVLPAMGAKLGLNYWGSGYVAGKGSTITIADWNKIVAWYLHAAPKKLPIPFDIPVLKDWANFKLIEPKAFADAATTTLLAFNPYNKTLYSADAANKLYTWDANLKPTLLTKLPSAATGALFNNANAVVLTCIGTLMPRDADIGKVIKYEQLGVNNSMITYADSLPRPVSSAAVDLDKDGLTDYVVCGFGHTNGALYWLKQNINGEFTKKIIRPVAGATNAVTGDFNHDGWPDIMCLFAQGDEGVWLFLNDHKGGFITKNLLKFPPAYGSSSFQLIDMNNDGAPDIIYTAGDNADTSPILKPYHGIYIFVNDGKFNFRKSLFYHMNGCTKAIAADFKGNGKLDIAAIAFFADKNKSDQGFAYLEQVAPMKFTAHQLPLAQYGKWLTMDVNDYNHDGCADIALGSFSFDNHSAAIAAGKPQYRLPLIVLQNQYRQKK